MHHVFIDTCIFRQYAFAYNGTAFQRLKELAAIRVLRLVSNDIIDREVSAGIGECVYQAESSLNKFRSSGSVLRSLDLPGLTGAFENLDKDSITGRLEQNYRKLKKSLRAIDLVVGELASINEVFDRYFSKSAPFDKKDKSEFPDAFVINAIAHWSNSRGFEVLVISQDSQMLEACNEYRNLHPFTTIDEALDYLSRVDVETRLKTELVHTWVANNKDILVENIKNEFEQLGFYLDDEGDISDIHVSGVEFDEASVLGFEGAQATISLHAYIEYEAEVSYPDPDGYYRDSDTRELISMGSIEETVSRYAEVPVEIELRLLDEEPEEVEITRLIVNNRLDVAVRLHDYVY